MLAECLPVWYSVAMGRSNSYSIVYSASRARAGRGAWLLVTPAGLSPTGKRRQQAFATEKEAKQALRQAQAAQAVLGEQVRHVILDPAAQAQWHRDRSVAEGVGLTTTSAIGFAAQCVGEFGSLEETLKLARWAKARAMQAWPDIYLADAFEEFRRDSVGLAPVSLRNRLAVHKRLLREEFEFCMNTPLHALTGQNVTELLERMNLTDATYNKVLSELFALCSWAQRKQYIDPDRHPLRHVRRKVYAETELHCLQPQQLQALLLTACTKHNPDVAVHVALGAFAGIRPYEARRLRWRDVDTEDHFISVRGRAAKTGGTRHITLRPVLRAWLDNLCPPASRKPDSLLVAKCSTTTQSILHRNAGMKKWPHDVLRHSFASYAIKAGTPLHEVQADMGHVGLNLLRTRYLNMAGLTKAGAVEWWSMTPDRVLP